MASAVPPRRDTRSRSRFPRSEITKRLSDLPDSASGSPERRSGSPEKRPPGVQDQRKNKNKRTSTPYKKHRGRKSAVFLLFMNFIECSPLSFRPAAPAAAARFSFHSPALAPAARFSFHSPASAPRRPAIRTSPVACYPDFSVLVTPFPPAALPGIRKKSFTP